MQAFMKSEDIEKIKNLDSGENDCALVFMYKNPPHELLISDYSIANIEAKKLVKVTWWMKAKKKFRLVMKALKS